MATGLLLGALVGMVMGLTGAGGGILAVPLLVFGMGMTVAEAGPVSLLALGLSAGAGALIGLRAGRVRYRAALLIAASGILMAPLGVWLAGRLDTSLLGLAFAGVLVWVAWRAWQDGAALPVEQGRVPGQPPCVRGAASGRFIWTGRCGAALTLAGMAAGVLSGLLGVGGGFVLVPALQRHTDLDAQAVMATSLSVIALVSLTGVAASVAQGQFALGVGLPFAGGSIAGMAAGSLLMPRLAPRYLKRAFAVLCLAVGAAMAMGAL